MAEPENLDDEFFDDLYNDDESGPAVVAEPAAAEAPAASNGSTAQDAIPSNHLSNGIKDYTTAQNGDEKNTEEEEEEIDLYAGVAGTAPVIDESTNQQDSPNSLTPPPTAPSSLPLTSTSSIGANDKASTSKEDGKMFIGGLNWETTDQSLRSYFSQFGEVVECTVMRDNSTGRSRGFGFLTFKDPKTVNIVMVKEHHLDGKIIDPKRAIPRDEQEKTSKIFVGGVSQETTDAEFKEYFAQFGRVVDATLMMDKDTGRPRGFGFVTFESEAGVDACLSADLAIHGKPIEVKKAQPRGNIREEEESSRRSGKFGKHNKFGGSRDGGSGVSDMGSEHGMGGGQNGSSSANNSSMTPQAMAQMFQRMQQMMQVQQMMMGRGGQGMTGMSQMNPMMAQQMMQMQMMGRGQGGPNSPMMGGMGGPMNPAMMQQMQQMQQQMMSGQGGNQAVPQGQGPGRPGFNAYEQQMFEQQKYEQHQRRQRDQSYGNNMQGNYNDQGWEGGMYDDGSQGNMNQANRQFRMNRSMTDPNNAPPANAPTGPKNQGKPGANMYRGGGRGGNRFHPYTRS